MALGDYTATLLRIVGGKMITLNHDTHPPHPRESFRLQGTSGVYLRGEERRIYVEGRSPDPHGWEDADAYRQECEQPLLEGYNPPARIGGGMEGHGSPMTEAPAHWARLIGSLHDG